MSEAKFYQFSDMPFKSLYGRVSSRFMAGEKLMFVEHRVKKGHVAKDDKHENEQLMLIVSGLVQITIGNETRLLKKGEAVIIPSWVVHSVEVLEDTIAFEVFSPPRQEWINR